MIFLKTDRLIIRDNIEDDLQGLYELTIDEENMRFMKSTRINSYEEALEHLNVSINESKKDNRKKYYFAIINKKTNDYVGAIGYDVLDNKNNERVVELGYFIKKEFWGKGFVFEAGRKIIDYAFNVNNVIKIEASCLKENNNSEKVMIKLGMKKEGELRKHQYHEGKWKNRLLYGLTKEEYNG